MDLPFEIWLYIISFLPLDQLQPLCTVNRAFYAVAMTEKCKVIDFGKDTRSIAGTLASLELFLFTFDCYLWNSDLLAQASF